jgi:hypothetical protein
MKCQLLLLVILTGAFALIALPARAQADAAPVATGQKADAGKWATPKKVEWSHADPIPEPEPEGQWLDGVEALQKVPQYTAREVRRINRDTLRAGKLDRRAARQAQKEARSDEKPRRIKN